MPWRDDFALARQAAGLPGFLRRPLSLAAAARAVADRLGQPAPAGQAGDRNDQNDHQDREPCGRAGEAAFLASLDRLVWSVPASPFRRLLVWAGCEPGDLRGMVAADGLEATLAHLRDAGVVVTADEFRGSAPLRRAGLELHLTAGDFDNPHLGGGVAGATSGSTGAGRLPVRYGWPFLEQEAADEALLLASHGLTAAPLAFWLPGPPGIAGLHNLLVHAKLGRPPARWFAPGSPPRPADGTAFRVERAWRLARRLLPRLGPAIEWVQADDAAAIARWLAAAPRPAALKCFAGAAARVGRAARKAGLDLSGTVVFAGGEPLTDARRADLEAAGARVVARYVATETGFIAGACPAAQGDEMHVYADRLAILGGDPDPRGSDDHDRGAGAARGPLAFTSLSLAAPKVLLNVELGDHGTLRRHACDCALGRAGLSLHVSQVHNPTKLSAEGVKLGQLDFARLVEQAVATLGGSPDDFQIQLLDAAAGDPNGRLRIALAPPSPVAPQALQAILCQTLPQLPGGALAAKLWFAGGALTIERRPLQTGAGHKIRRVLPAADDPSAAPQPAAAAPEDDHAP